MQAVEEVRCFRALIAEVSEGVAMPQVSAALGDNVDGAAIGKSELRSKTVAVNLKLLDRVDRV